ncbi:MAG TPA: DUF4214 domain-containing protein [Actinobacteria bacterium]|nr:DUF4214 domain-containing protein [Actinomycetota bacterium]
MLNRKKVKIISAVFIIFSVIIFAFPSSVFAENSTGVEGFVTRLYNTCLDRNPDPDGFANWVNNLVTGRITGGRAAYGFIFSDELINKNLNNDEFLIVMYKAFFDRSPDPGGYENWMGLLNSGSSREFVFSNFVNSDEFANICSKYGIQAGKVRISGSRTSVPTSSPGKNIVVMGDSLINKSDWTQRLGGLINSSFPDSGYNVIGSAVNGEMSFQGLARFDSTIAPLNPGIIIIAYGTNDIGSDPGRFQSSIEQLIEKSKRTGAMVFLNLVGPIYHSGKSSWPVFNQIIMNVAARYGVPVIDVANPLNQNPGENLSEGMHYSSAGADVVSRVAYSAIYRYLR